MTFKGRLQRGLELANITRIRFLTSVDPNMVVEIGLLRGSELAKITRKRFFAGMN